MRMDEIKISDIDDVDDLNFQKIEIHEELRDEEDFINRLDALDIDEIFAGISEEDAILFSPQIEIFEPFAAHVDASRTNMSSKQILQTVTSRNNECPFILNKNYGAMTKVKSPYTRYAEDDGIVVYSNFNFLIVYYTNLKNIIPIYTPAVKRMTNNAITLKFKKNIENRKFKKGDLLVDYTGQTVDLSVPKIGYRTRIMYGSFYGYTAEDAFVASQSYSERAVMDYAEKLYIPITKELKYLKNKNSKYFYGVNEITSKNYLEYFKLDLSDSFLAEFNNVSDTNSKLFGRQVQSINGATVTSVKVHRLTDKFFDDNENIYMYSPGMILELKHLYERQLLMKKDIFNCLNALFSDEDSANYTNNLFMQFESSNTLSPNIIESAADEFRVAKENIDYILEIDIHKEETTTTGDKFANVFAGKGVCSLIIPDDLMPKDEYGEPVDIIFNPLGLFGRNNWGTIFEIGLAKIIQDVEDNIRNKEEIIDKIAFINDNFISKFDTEYSKQISNLLSSISYDDEIYESFRQSVIKDGFYLFVDNFPGIAFKQFTDDFLVPYQEKYKINITEKTQTMYSKELLQWMIDRGFVSNVFDEFHAEDVPQEVYIGSNYWIKLFHTSNSKYNATGFTENHSKSTGQAARGRKNNGAHHMSWQSRVALEAHMENNPIAKELWTIKSDAIYDKNNYFRKMISTGTYVLKDKYKSATLNTLNKGLNLIGMKFSNIQDNSEYLDELEDFNSSEENLEDATIDELEELWEDLEIIKAGDYILPELDIVVDNANKSIEIEDDEPEEFVAMDESDEDEIDIDQSTGDDMPE